MTVDEVLDGISSVILNHAADAEKLEVEIREIISDAKAEWEDASWRKAHQLLERAFRAGGGKP
jgi:predicted Zn-dependent peptidase